MVASGAMRRFPRPRAVFALAPILAVALAVAGCGMISTTPPAPTPADFQGIASEIVRRGIDIRGLVSGDAGCDDIDLARTAIRFTGHGLDQDEPRTLYLYIFRNRTSYEKLRGEIDRCAGAYVTDPETFESIEDSPFVLAGQGPWAPEFRATLREALRAAAGTGN